MWQVIREYLKVVYMIMRSIVKDEVWKLKVRKIIPTLTIYCGLTQIVVAFEL